jgi:hypothetical protein
MDILNSRWFKQEYLSFYWITIIINVQFSLINVRNSCPDF